MSGVADRLKIMEQPKNVQNLVRSNRRLCIQHMANILKEYRIVEREAF